MMKIKLRKMHLPVSVKTEVWLPFITALTVGSIFSMGGFVDYDESHVTLNTLKLMKQWTHPLENPLVLIWPEQGTVGPILYYINAFMLTVLSFLFKLPMDFSARMTSVLAFAVSCIFIKRICDRIAGSKGGWIASALFILCPLTQYIGHLILGEALAVALLLGAIDAIQRKRNAISGLLYGTAILTRITLLPVFPAMLWLLLNDKENRLYKFSRFIIPFSLTMIPFIIILISGRTGVFDAISDRQMSSHSELLNPDAIRLWFTGLSPGILMLGIWGAIRLFRQNRIAAIFLALWGILPTLQIITMGTVLPRYFYHVNVAWIIAAAACIVRHEEQFITLRWTIIIALMTSTLVSSKYLPFPSISALINGESAYLRAAKFVLENSQQDDIIATGNPALFYIFLRRPVLVNVNASTMVKEKDNILAEADHWGHKRIKIDKDLRYLVLREKDYNDFVKNAPDLASLFNTVYNGAEEGAPVIRVLANPVYSEKNTHAYGTHIKDTELNLADALGLIKSKGMQIVNSSKAVPIE